MINQSSLLRIAYQSLFPCVHRREHLLKAYNIKVIELFHELVQTSVLVVGRIGLNWGRPHEHVLGEQTDVPPRQNVTI